ncbi:DUF2505 domain-containing protein [Mycolicibacterium vaccae]|uniref:DUF2505 domain-containing protein n=1 Tax=Mycolicibacterium vaccae TaxID=1810 RepID=UPI003D06A877
MPRSFEVTAEAPADVADVLAAFADRDYWLARLAEYGGESMYLDALDVDASGTVVVRSTQNLREDMLPGAIARLLPGDTKLMRTETWRPDGAGRACGEFVITARGVPSSGSGAMVLEAVGSGSRLRVSGSLEVRIPMVGGRIEGYVADLIGKDVPQMHQFTADWISRRT